MFKYLFNAMVAVTLSGALLAMDNLPKSPSKFGPAYDKLYDLAYNKADVNAAYCIYELGRLERNEIEALSPIDNPLSYNRLLTTELITAEGKLKRATRQVFRKPARKSDRLKEKNFNKFNKAFREFILTHQNQEQ